MKLTEKNLQDVYNSPKCTIETMELKGYKLIEELFVDSSGLGLYNEPALTQSRLMDKLKSILKKHSVVYSTITKAGQFQVYIGLFSKTGVKQCKKIANNTLEINKNGKKIIRFHDTDIITHEGHAITLDNGGYQTVTTKQRMNEYLSGEWYIYQRDFNWYVKSVNTLKSVPYENGMVLTLKKAV